MKGAGRVYRILQLWTRKGFGKSIGYSSCGDSAVRVVTGLRVFW
jgi:hypothetical protein